MRMQIGFLLLLCSAIASADWINTGGGGSGITSINSDSTAAQTIAGSNNISASTSGGTTTINGTLLLPKASPSWTGTMGTPLTSSNVVATDGSGNLTVFGATSSVVTLTGSQTLTNKTLTAPSITSPTGFVEEFTGHIQTAGNSTYWIDPYPAYAYTINSLAIYTSSGTITCAVQINGTNVTSLSAVSVSSTPSLTSATGANSVSAGASNAVTLVCSSNSSALDLVYTLKVTR